MPPRFLISTGRTRSSPCLIKQCYFEHHRSLFLTSKTAPSIYRPPLLWFLATKSFSTVDTKKKINHRNLPQHFDLNTLVDSFDGLTEKDRFKLLRVALYNTTDPEQAWLIYNTMVQYQVDHHLRPNHHVQLFNLLKSSGQVDRMLTLLDHIKKVPTEEVYPISHHISQILFTMGKQGLVHDVYQFMQHMVTEAKQHGNPAEPYDGHHPFPSTQHFHSLAIALRNSRKRRDPVLVEQVTGMMIEAMVERQTRLDQPTLSMMLSVLSTRGFRRERLMEFLKASEAVGDGFNVYIYTTLVSGLARHGDADGARRVVDEMIKHQVEPNQVTIACLMEAYGRSGDFDAAQKLLEDYPDAHTPVLLTSLLVNALRHHNAPVADRTVRLIEDKIAPHDQDTMLRTALLWFKAKKDIDVARLEFEAIWSDNQHALNSVAVNHLIKGLSETQREKKAVMSLLKNNPVDCVDPSRSQHYLANAMFHCRDVPAALSVFAKMRSQKVPDDITVAMVIQGLVMNNEENLAWRLFKTLQADQIQPNLYAYSTILRLLGHRDSDLKRKKQASDLDPSLLQAAGIRSHTADYQKLPSITTEALALFRQLTQQQPNVYTYTTLISCFAKNNLNQALKVFEHMCQHVQPTVETYTALLQGCSIFRNSGLALSLFNHMCERQIQPNETTWRYLLKSFVRSRVDPKEIDKIGDMARKSLGKSQILDKKTNRHKKNTKKKLNP